MTFKKSTDWVMVVLPRAEIEDQYFRHRLRNLSICPLEGRAEAVANTGTAEVHRLFKSMRIARLICLERRRFATPESSEALAEALQ